MCTLRRCVNVCVLRAWVYITLYVFPLQRRDRVLDATRGGRSSPRVGKEKVGVRDNHFAPLATPAPADTQPQNERDAAANALEPQVLGERAAAVGRVRARVCHQSSPCRAGWWIVEDA